MARRRRRRDPEVQILIWAVYGIWWLATLPIRVPVWLWRRSRRAKREHVPAGQQPTEKQLHDFYNDPKWRRLSYSVKKERGWKCEAWGCGAEAPEARIVTDHIKSVRLNWDMRWDRSNLQVLCDACNVGKGSYDNTDFRVPRKRPGLLAALGRGVFGSGAGSRRQSGGLAGSDGRMLGSGSGIRGSGAG